MGVSAAVATAVIGAYTAVDTTERAKSQSRQIKRDKKFASRESARMEKQNKQRAERDKLQERYRKQRQAQKNVSGQGRQGTILGGAGNTGNQAQAPGGKTLLGV